MTAGVLRTFEPTYAVPPGQTLADLLADHDMTQTEVARRLGVSLKHINQVIKGSASISPDLALGLEKVMGPSAAFWATREAHYQAALARQRETHKFESAVEWAEQFPISELKQRELLPSGASGPVLVAELLQFLGIAHPEQWVDPCVAYRKSQKVASDRYALSAWLRAGEREAAALECNAFDHDRFAAALETVRGLTRQSPAQWHGELVRLCAEAGVAVVIVDAFAGAKANGATRWLSPSKALIQLSLRYRWEDIFWFTFFHEAGHVVLHRKRDLFLEGDASLEEDDAEIARMEAEADRFASRTLIPAHFDRRLRDLSVSEIPAFADLLGVAPAIVVGRLQHDGLIPFSYGNKLRRRFSFS